MSNQRPLETLHTDLIRRGLPAWYVRRVAEELEDHQEDLEANALPGSESRLGNVAELADRIVAEFRASRFAGRHPALVFVIAPIPLVVLTWVGIALGLALGCSLEAAEGVEDYLIVNIGAGLIYYTLRFVPFAAAALILCRSAYRAARGRWSLAACVLVALLAGSLVADLKFHVGTELGTLDFRPIFLTPGIATHSFAAIGGQVAQMAVPLAIWVCFAVRFERRRRLAMKAANLIATP